MVKSASETSWGGCEGYFTDPDGLSVGGGIRRVRLQRRRLAHDLGVVWQAWNEELLAGDTVKVALERCDEVASRSGVDPVAMWQWAFIERVSTGLFLLCLGHQAEAAAYPEVSDRLAEVASPRA